MAGLNDLINLNAINIVEEAEILADRHPRRYHPFINPFEEYSDRRFVELYRLTKPVAVDLINILEPHLTAPSRESALSIPRKVSICFFGLGTW